MMKRRTFMQIVAASPIASSIGSKHADASDIPKYLIDSQYKPAAVPGMPGPCRGEVVSVKSTRCLSENGEQINAEVVREMLERGMRSLTGEAKTEDAWRRFFTPADVVGIKVNCGGRPWVGSSHPIVAEDGLQL